MTRYSYIVTDDNISLVVNGNPYSVPRSSVQANQLLDALRRGADANEVEALCSMATCVKTYSLGDVEIKGEEGFFQGTPLPQVLVDRLLDCIREKIPYECLLKFIQRLHENPSKRSVEQLYQFLEHENLPITPAGTFLAYKAIRNDWVKSSPLFA